MRAYFISVAALAVIGLLSWVVLSNVDSSSSTSYSSASTRLAPSDSSVRR